MNLALYKDAKNKLINGDYSVESFFKQNNFVLEYGYSKLLQGDIKSAEDEFFKMKEFDTRAYWGCVLVQLIRNSVKDFPTYFQIRNFLEIDLNLMLNAGLAEFVENVINSADWLFSINPECYKFISRVMLNNNFNEVAIIYLIKAKNKYYQDPEMHFMLANCYLKQGDVAKARDELETCLNILPEYYPAKKVLLSL